MQRDVKTVEDEMEQLFCKENLLKLGFAMTAYNRKNHVFPAPSKWCDILSDEPTHLPETLQIRSELFRCKGAGQGPCNYAMNKYAENLGTNAPGDMVLLFDSTPGWNQSGGPEMLSTENHQGRGCNIMFVNGHVEWVQKEDLHTLRWTASDIP